MTLGRRHGLIFIKAGLPLVVLGIAVALALYMMRGTPGAEREAAPERRPQLVEVTRVERSTHRLRIKAWGTVEAAKDIQLRARVGGEVVSVSDSLAPGGRFEKGEQVLRIDPRDYRLALAQARSDLQQAKGDLRLEEGNQQVAEEEYKLLQEQLPNADRSLVLREPQLQTARARVKAAKANVRQAELNLERTTVEAPFDAKVVTEAVDPGTNLSTQDVIARLVGTDRYRVEIAVPASKLRWINSTRDDDDAVSEVILRNPSVWDPGKTRQGFVRQILPDLTEKGRMARLLVEVPDPLARRPENEGQPRLLMGAYLQARIRAKTLRDVIPVDRAHLRQDDSVWVMNETDRLEIRAVEILYRGADRIYVGAGLASGERVVTSPLPAAAPGMPLRVRDRNGQPGVDDVG